MSGICVNSKKSPATGPTKLDPGRAPKTELILPFLIKYKVQQPEGSFLSPQDMFVQVTEEGTTRKLSVTVFSLMNRITAMYLLADILARLAATVS